MEINELFNTKNTRKQSKSKESKRRKERWKQKINILKHVRFNSSKYWHTIRKCSNTSDKSDHIAKESEEITILICEYAMLVQESWGNGRLSRKTFMTKFEWRRNEKS